MSPIGWCQGDVAERFEFYRRRTSSEPRPLNRPCPRVREEPLSLRAPTSPGVRFLASFAAVLSACVPCPQNVTFGPAFGPLTQHFHISTINAAAFTKQRKPTLFDQQRQSRGLASGAAPRASGAAVTRLRACGPEGWG